MHPFSAVVGASGLLISLILVREIAGLIVLFIICLSCFLVLRIELNHVLKSILRVWPLLLLTFCLHLVISGRGTVSLSEITTNGLEASSFFEATLFTVRLIVILSIGIGLAYLFSPADLAREVGRWMRGLPFGRRTAAQTELLIMLSLQFVPFIDQERQRLQLALAARGGHHGSGRMGRILTWRKLMFPLLVNAFRRADHISLAIQARGYDPDVRRTSLKTVPVPTGQIAMTIVFVALCSVAPWI